MKVIYVIGKFRAPTAWEIAENVRAAEREGLEVARMGASPLIPHANTAHFHGQCADEFWLEATLELAMRSDAAITVQGDEWKKSSGSIGEVERLRSSGRPVFHDRENLRAWLAEQDYRSRLTGPRANVAESGEKWHTTREQDMVREFNLKMGCVRGETPEIRAAELRARLIEEEARETADALRRGDLAEAVDGLCDLQYVVLGAADVLGVPLGRFFDEVHRTNMLKLGGPRRADGKILKPEGWQPPRIAAMLDELLTFAGPR